ncbi:uncharacterized protein LOC111359804 [Spodoptera litura]|uniref:Uncharacterized protein LOC111359804 n=1 Tax=Spodoptera litura TaxID=69820 RepID=A0A9J7J034_SPOLT|nr:uncharacterized protein LOC111359804 [Spodoptera litura]
MFTVSCYVFHPLLQRLVRLWRYVQVVSDVLTFFLAMLCCQCAAAVPFSTSSSMDSKPSVQIFKAEALTQKQEEIENDQSCGEPVKAHHLVIDFAPGREDTPEIQERCHQYWQDAKNRQEHNNMSSKSKNLIDLSKTGSHPDRSIESQSNIPSVHTHKKHNKKGNVQTALDSSTAIKYHT